jgi:putative ATP-dependent endonuclease of OLD family
LEEAGPDVCYPLDLSGVTIITSDGDGALPEFGAFFQAMGLHTFAFYDKKPRKLEEVARLGAAYDVPRETAYTGLEHLLATETPCGRQWEFLSALRDGGEATGIPTAKPSDDTIRALTVARLKGDKGSGLAGRLIAHCDAAEIPKTIRDFLTIVYSYFPRPEAVPPIDPVETGPIPAAE